MSDYGRLWQRTSDIRTLLAKPPAIDTSTLEKARASAKFLQAWMDGYFAEWQELERQMALEPE